MKDIKRMMSILLALCLLLALAACGGGDAGDTARTETGGEAAAQPEGEAPAEAAPAEQPAQEQVTVHFGTGEKNGFYSEELASATLTAQVPQDGTYLLDLYAQGAYGDDAPKLAVSSPDEALAVVNSQTSYGDAATGGLYCLVELTAGEYTLQAENVCDMSADLTLTYPLESVLGPMGAGTYVGTLEEAMTVNYTLTGTNAHVEFYNGSADALGWIGSCMALDLEDTGEPDTDRSSISFEPGTVVIDFQDHPHDGALEGVEADMSTNEAAVLKGASIDFVQEGNENGFGFNSHSADEPATATATIAGDGYYFLNVVLTTYYEGDEFTFSSDVPALPDLAAAPDWATAPSDFAGDETRIYMVTDVASGEYTMTIGNVMCDASFFPLQTVDSLAGDFAGGGMYVCFLDAPATVTFTIDSDRGIRFYGGAEEDGFLQDLTPDADTARGTVTIDFPAGAAVIDTHYGYSNDSVTGAMS